MPTVKIRPKFERYRSVMGCVGELWNYDRFYIHEGYHSYLTEEMAKGRMLRQEYLKFQQVLLYISTMHIEKQLVLILNIQDYQKNNQFGGYLYSREYYRTD